MAKGEFYAAAPVVLAAVAEAEVSGHGGLDGGVIAEGDEEGRYGALSVGDVGSHAAHVGGVGGAVHGAVAVVVVAENALAVEAADGAVVARGGGDVAFGDGAVADGAFVAVAHDAADAQSAFDAGIGDVDVVDDGVAAYLAEETLVVVGDVGAGLAESDAADGVAVAVKIAVEFADVAVVVASYGLIVLVVVVGLVRVVRESDIGSEFEVLVLVVVGGLAVRAVHTIGEQQQLVLIIYNVGV